MQINSLLPVLLSILTRQAGQNKVNRAQPGHDAGRVARQGAGKPAETAALGGGSTVREDLQAARQPSPGHSLPDFLPLPLKTPLFTESGFYIKNQPENSPQRGEDGRSDIFIRLRTENLGLVWISLAARSESLKVSFYTENDSFTDTLRESFPGLVEGLRKLGYPSVSAAGITRPGIRDCAGIDPEIKASAVYLLDLEV
ncbi:MAG: flagellar hook-length control protein FliK [Peptococcaceae bacterium]|nr:flagellar hook-length control protein FliK [Peptococcaceae bacterium]